MNRAGEKCRMISTNTPSALPGTAISIANTLVPSVKSPCEWSSSAENNTRNRVDEGMSDNSIASTACSESRANPCRNKLETFYAKSDEYASTFPQSSVQ